MVSGVVALLVIKSLPASPSCDPCVRSPVLLLLICILVVSCALICIGFVPSRVTSEST